MASVLTNQDLRMLERLARELDEAEALESGRRDLPCVRAEQIRYIVKRSTPLQEHELYGAFLRLLDAVEAANRWLDRGESDLSPMHEDMRQAATEARAVLMGETP